MAWNLKVDWREKNDSFWIWCFSFFYTICFEIRRDRQNHIIAITKTIKNIFLRWPIEPTTTILWRIVYSSFQEPSWYFEFCFCFLLFSLKLYCIGTMFCCVWNTNYNIHAILHSTQRHSATMKKNFQKSVNTPWQLQIKASATFLIFTQFSPPFLFWVLSNAVTCNTLSENFFTSTWNK